MVAQIDSLYRQRGLARTLRRFISYGLFEGRPATTKWQWINPFVLTWLRALARWPGQPRVHQPIFIVGLGRTGTTILGVVLSLHRDVGFLNEPKAMWQVIDPRQDINGNYSPTGGRFRMAEGDVSPAMVRTAHRVFSRYLSTAQSRRVIDKYPELVFRVPYVQAIFPDARFVFIYRNGVDACQSIVQWSKRLGRGEADRREDWWGRNDSKWRMFWEELIEADPTYSSVAALGPAAIDQVNRAALEWIVTMREGVMQAQAAPDVVARIRYEDLVAQPEAELTRLMSSCGLPVEQEVLSYAAASLRDNPSKALPALLPPIQFHFDETMALLGYPTAR